MRTSWVTCAAIGLLEAAALGAASNQNVIVASDHVNIRAKPAAQSVVVGQCAAGEILKAKQVGEEWVEIVPPARISLWVYRDLVDGGVVTVSKLKVRVGPGFLFEEAGTLGKGDKVTVQSEEREWLKIDPPETCSLWVSRKLVKLGQSGPPAPVSVPAPARSKVEVPAVVTTQAVPVVSPPPTVASAPVVEAPTKPAPPEDLVRRGLVPLEGQGRTVQVEGVLQPAGYLLGPPSKYRLVERAEDGLRTLCYLRGNNAQLSTFLGRRLLVSGREYWLQGVREAIVVPEQITPK
jgi:hypothetical protein